jgi:hypothetical protein
MSGHTDIRCTHHGAITERVLACPYCQDEFVHRLDALVAENQRLRDALTAIASWESPLGVEYAAECYSKAQAVARAALAGTPSEDA